MKDMYCPSCGSYNDEDSLYCAYCGEPLPHGAQNPISVIKEEQQENPSFYTPNPIQSSLNNDAYMPSKPSNQYMTAPNSTTSSMGLKGLKARKEKNVILAVILSIIIPGAGYFYLEQHEKAIKYFLLSLILLTLFSVFGIFYYLYVIHQTYKDTIKYNSQLQVMPIYT